MTDILGDRSSSADDEPVSPIPFRTEQSPDPQERRSAGEARDQGRTPPRAPRGAAHGDRAQRVNPIVPDGQHVDPRGAPQHKLSAEQQPQGPGSKTYTVQSGDTLWQIAYREVDQGGDTGRIVDLIQELNPTIDAQDLQIGQTIRLPVELPEGAESKDLTRKAVENEASVYTVAAGDTLRSIAQAQLGDSNRWKEIYRLNPNTIREPSQIRVGLRILVPQQ